MPQISITPSDLDYISSLFDENTFIELGILLPPLGDYHGLTFHLYNSFKLKIVTAVHPASPVQPYIPGQFQQAHYVVSIDNIEPITPACCAQNLQGLQNCMTSNQITLIFRPVDIDKTFNYKGLQSLHDSIRFLRHNFTDHRRTKPKVPNSIYNALDSANRTNWIDDLYHQYNKNQAFLL